MSCLKKTKSPLPSPLVTRYGSPPYPTVSKNYLLHSVDIPDKKNFSREVEPAMFYFSEVHHEIADVLVMREAVKMRHGEFELLFQEAFIRDAKFKELLEVWVRAFYCNGLERAMYLWQDLDGDAICDVIFVFSSQSVRFVKID